MLHKSKKFSFVSYKLNHRLKIAFHLLLLLPLLVSLYLASNYIIPRFAVSPEIVVFMIISIVMALGGFFLLKEVFDRIIALSNEAKRIASGDFSRKVQTGIVDEVGDLGDALNKLASRIRNNMEELKKYSEKTSEINMEIQKRVLVLSSLMQLSSLISQGRRLDEIVKLAVEKARLVAGSDMAYFFFKDPESGSFLMRATDGGDTQSLLAISMDSVKSVFERVLKNNKPLIVDEANSLPEASREVFNAYFKLKNTAAQPVHFKGELIGILGIGSAQEKFSYKKDDIDLLDIFAKQLAISVENDLLLHKVEKLEIRDSLTGLYNLTFVRNRLDEEIKRSIIYHRPCALIHLQIDNFQHFYCTYGLLATEAAVKKTASLIQDTVTEIDRVGRTGDNTFGIILPEKNKRLALEISRQVLKSLAFGFSEEPDLAKRFNFSVGISENPLDGVTAEELISKAKNSLVSSP